MTFDEYHEKYPDTPTCSEKYSAKLSAAEMGNTRSLGRKRTDEAKAKMSAVKMGGKHTEETKAKMSAAHMGRKLTDEHKAKMSAAMMGNTRSLGYKHTDETKTKMSGENASNWKGGISFEPYCPKFNNKKKEEIRNKYNRTCIISGISVLQNGRRLCVDHIDENKMQGCDGIPWRLIPLAHLIHCRMQMPQNHLLLELLLYSNKLAQMNYMFPEEFASL